MAAVGQVAPQAMLQVLRADVLEPRGCAARFCLPIGSPQTE